jgi:O-acetyl-ADP-ribose deacetylase (regulator of RNase III)
MVKVLIGDLFKSEAQTLVNTVNTVGVMGKGIALEFKRRFPDMYEDYKRRCDAGQVRLGRPYLFPRLLPPWILNFPTKDDWRSVTKLQDIINGMAHLEAHYREWGITSLAVPPLGCGQGQLEWRVVGPTLYRQLSDLDIPVELYAPFGTPHEELRPSYLGQPSPAQALDSTATRINPAWVALVDILQRIEAEPFHRPIGRVTFQKIAYFATRLGLPTQLDYVRGSYGPYSAGLKSIETKLVNNGLIREERLGQMLRVRVGPTYRDARRAYDRELQKWDTAIDRLADLFLRMPTKDAEVAATVHFVFLDLGQSLKLLPTESEVLTEVMRWKQRRRPPLKPEEVAKMIRSLNMLGWVNLQFSEELPVSEKAVVGF